jgi:hypothetical protein
MSNKEEDFPLILLWRKAPFSQKLIAMIVSVLLLSLVYGFGLTAGRKGERAEIIIEQCAD